MSGRQAASGRASPASGPWTQARTWMAHANRDRPDIDDRRQQGGVRSEPPKVRLRHVARRREEPQFHRLEPQEVLADTGVVRLFSIDGGHTSGITQNDVALAEAALCNGGVVILDAFFNESWPGVAEGAVRYLTGGGSRLIPVGIGGNKFILTNDEAMAAAYRKALASLSRTYRIQDQVVFGSSVEDVRLVGDEYGVLAFFGQGCGHLSQRLCPAIILDWCDYKATFGQVRRCGYITCPNELASLDAPIEPAGVDLAYRNLQGLEREPDLPRHLLARVARRARAPRKRRFMAFICNPLRKEERDVCAIVGAQARGARVPE